MDFITIKVTCPSHFNDYLIGVLFEIGFDSFQEFADGFEGSCVENKFDMEKTQAAIGQFEGVTFQLIEQEKINWNEEWEKNYDPIIVENKCIVRAAFHSPQPDFEYEIIVTPKMSFGTGHHATTYQILAYQMTLDHTDKRVLDVGTGTGILSIMAMKRGAKEIVATDIDDWCIENASENFELNHIENQTIYKTEIEKLEESGFDIIIANINKNVLMNQLGEYSNKLKPGGLLLLSGFYENDIADLLSQSSHHLLSKESMTVKDNWAMLVLLKQSV